MVPDAGDAVASSRYPLWAMALAPIVVPVVHMTRILRLPLVPCDSPHSR